MRTVTFAKAKTVEIVDKPVPEIEPDEVLVKVTGAGLCHSDLHIIEDGDSPLVGETLGHEGAGIVDQVGADVSRWKAGDPVLISLVLSCGECRECLAGRDVQCLVASPRGSLAPLAPGIGAPGAMAEYIAVKSHHLDPLGALDPATAAPLADAALTPMHAIKSVRERLTGDATVVVLGIGGLGHVGLQILSATCGSKLSSSRSTPTRRSSSTLARSEPSRCRAMERPPSASSPRPADAAPTSSSTSSASSRPSIWRSSRSLRAAPSVSSASAVDRSAMSPATAPPSRGV